jgi:hypothetical protein
MIKSFFNHLRFYVVVVMDFNEKRSKNETRPSIRLCIEDSWLTKCSTSECYRTSGVDKNYASCFVVWPEFGNGEGITEIK